MKKIKPWQRMWRVCCLVLVLLGITSALHAQSAITISASKTSIVAGESVQLTATSSTVSDLSAFVWQYMEEGSFSFLPLPTPGPTITVTPTKTTQYRGYILSPFANAEAITITVVIPRDLVISANKTDLSLGEDVTLTATTETDVLLGRVRWQKQVGNGSFEDMHTVTGTPVIGETVTDIPQAGGTCYRAIGLKASGEEVISETVCVTSKYTCATNSAHVLFTEDFGQLGGETERDNGGYGGEVEYINKSIYTYVGDCKPLKDAGTYAIMTNPKYAGYGELKKDDDACSNIDMGNLWFRDLYDHTSDGLKDGEWGAMLMVNAATLAGQSEQLVYSRTVDMPCTNTNMIFSAWFANAANPDRVDANTISMKFVVRDQNNNIIESATLQVNEIKPKDGWVKGETSFNSGNNEKLTVEIYNCEEGGAGNDFMVDDISFSICTPEISLEASSSDQGVEVDNEKFVVSGTCNAPLELTLQTGTAEVIFGNPYYLWYVKTSEDDEFQLVENYNNQTTISTAVTPYTQYYAVATANEQDAELYKQGKLSICSPVAITNTYTLLCTPNLSIENVYRKCNDITLWRYNDPNGRIDFWWEVSNDGKNWSKINRTVVNDSLHYTITQDTYFRLNSDMVASEATEKQIVKNLSLQANPAIAPYGTNVALTATSSNLEMTGATYNWYNKYGIDPTTGEQAYQPLDPASTTEPNTTYMLEQNEITIVVTADGCEAEAEVKQIEFDVEPMGRECNDILLQAIATLGGEPTENYKWQSSTDGTNWKDVPASAITPANDVNCPNCVKIAITEKSMFRIAGTGEISGIVSDTQQAEFYEYKLLQLSANSTYVKSGDEVEITLQSEGFDPTAAPEWYKGEEQIEPITEKVTITETTTYTVKWEGCSASTTVTVIEPAEVILESRNCNTITFKATLTPGYGDFWWETAKVEEGTVVDEYPAVTSWEKVADSDNKETLKLTITEAVYVRVNNDYGIPSEAVISGDFWTLTLDADKNTIKRDETVTLTVTTNISSNNTPQWYQNNATITVTQNPYSPQLKEDATFYVTLEGCTSNNETIEVIQPVSVELVSRDCNEITLKANSSVPLSSITWQISIDGGENWDDLTERGNPIEITITEDAQFRVATNGATSEPTPVVKYKEIEISIDKEAIILGDAVTITANSTGMDEADVITWYEDNQPLSETTSSLVVKPYGVVVYQAIQAGCFSNKPMVTEVLWPTVFTPLLVDGFNDDFVVGMQPAIALKIYDRYGNLMIETTDGWDGKDAKGNYAQPGVYYYIATLPNDEVVKGNVELLNEKQP